MHSIEAEASVLGGFLVDADKLDELAGIVDESFFGAVRHRELYRAMRAVHDEGMILDAITLGNRLKSWGAYDRAGGAEYLAHLMASVPTAANIAYHAKIVRDKAHLRQIREVGGKILALAESGAGAEEVQEEAERLIYGTGDQLQQVDVSLEHVRVGMRAALEKLEKNEPDVLTGFRDLDWQMQGFAKGDLAILAARPSMGKTALGMQIAVNNAYAKRGNVAVFSLEMSIEAICRRMIFTEACVDGIAFRRDSSEDALVRVGNAVEQLNKLPLFVTDKAATVVQIRGQLRRLAKESKQPIRLVMIDYLGKMRGSGRYENRVHELGEITGDLKRLAVEFDCPVLLLCQLSRGVEQRTNKKPMLSDLRDSGEIEQDADTVMMLYRPDYYEKADKDGHSQIGKAEVIVAKHRNGKTGEVPLTFYAEYTRFEDVKEWKHKLAG